MCFTGTEAAILPYNELGVRDSLSSVWKVRRQFGFSLVGVVFLLMLFIPNMRWAKNQPLGYEEIAAHESKVLLVFERIGEVACSCGAVVFVCPRVLRFRGFSGWWPPSFLVWGTSGFTSATCANSPIAIDPDVACAWLSRNCMVF